MWAGAVGHGVNTVLFMVMYPVYLHYLGYARYGVWLALGSVIAFAQLGELGIGAAVAKLVSEIHGRDGDARFVPAYLAWSVTLLGGIGLVVTLLVLLCRGPILDLFAFTPAMIDTARRIFPAIAVLSLLAIVSQPFPAILEGLGRIDLAHGIRALGRTLGFACTVALLTSGYGLVSLVWGNVLGFTTVTLGSLAIATRLTPYRLLVRPVWEPATVGRILRFGTGLSAGRVVGMLIDPFNRVMLSRFSGVDALPVYDIAFRGCQTLRAFADMALRALVAEGSRLNGLDSPAGRVAIRRLFISSTRALIVGGIAIGLPLMIAADSLLAVWLRAGLQPSQAHVFRIMLLGTGIAMVSIPAYNIVLGMGHVRDTVASHVIQALVNVTCLTVYMLTGSSLTPSVVAGSLVAAWTLAACFMIVRACGLTALASPTPRPIGANQ